MALIGSLREEVKRARRVLLDPGGPASLEIQIAGGKGLIDVAYHVS